MAAIISLIRHFLQNFSESIFLAAIYCITLVLVIIFSNLFSKRNSRKIFLLDFSCYKPPPSLMCSKKEAAEKYKKWSNCSAETLYLFENGMFKAGLGDSTYTPAALLKVPPNPSLETARQEAEMVVFGAVDDLLAKTCVDCSEIGILIVNCSVFNAVPSISSMIVNRYKMKENIREYNITGMGCTAGLIAVSVAKHLLQVHKDQYALVVSTEILTENCYKGNDLSKTASNCVFRLGGAAVLLSNRPSDSKNSKYQLIHTVHVNTASSDTSYSSIFQEEDKEGLVGISITKDLLVAARTAIESNLSMLGPRILPLSEKINFLKNLLARRFYIGKAPPRYVPKFNLCIEHFFPHVGGKMVLDQLQNILGFSDSVMEAARMSLYRFGNTSSSSVWYELAYAEAKGKIKKGDRLWQMAYGSGFKCSSLIWKAMRDIELEEMNPWSGEIEDYPVNLDNIGKLDPKLYFFESS